MRTVRSSVLAGGLALAGCGHEPAPRTATEVVAVHRTTLPPGPDGDAWDGAPAFRAPLVVQDMVEPRLLTPSTGEVRVQAMTDGARLATRLTWSDATADDRPAPSRFSDACAIQLPATTAPNVPAPQMGEPQRPVEITYWRAAWQATMDGRPHTVQALYPGASVDHYPFEAPVLPADSAERHAMADRYAPARAAGNPMARVRTTAVEDLVGEGPSTLRPATATRSTGRGVRENTGWAVVLVRPLPNGVQPGDRTQIAFAIWDGAHGESGARKMRSAWVPLRVEGHP